MERQQEGEWTVFRAKTWKPFELFKTDASRGLMQGLSGLVTRHEWRGRKCFIYSLGAEADVTLDCDMLVGRVRFTSPIGRLLKDKILSDVAHLTEQVAGRPSTDNRDVFIVHGHNEEYKLELRQMVQDFGLNPIILHEQDDQGHTIIEKLEYFGSASSFAFILMTPDDRAQLAHASTPEEQLRARQNVVLELGWFMARLGRERVAILCKGDLEIPSDVFGVLYIPFENSVREGLTQITQRLRGVGLMS